MFRLESETAKDVPFQWSGQGGAQASSVREYPGGAAELVLHQLVDPIAERAEHIGIPGPVIGEWSRDAVTETEHPLCGDV